MNVILIDDEQIALEYFQLQLKNIEDVHVIGAYVNPEEAMEAILNQAVDVVFLDIHMPGEDGVSLAQRILEQRPEIIIVFVTAFEQYAVHAFDLNAIDYVVKPVKRKRLAETIKRIQTKLEGTQKETASQEKDVFRIQMCKQFHIEPMRASAQTIRWRTARVKELFLLLLQNREQVVHKDYIIDIIWPEMDFERASAQLYTTVYHIRQVLKAFNEHFKLENTTNGYILFTKNVEIDVEKWEHSLQALPPLTSETIDAYERVMNYYSASYLNDHQYIWAMSEANRLDQKWVKKAIEIAKQHEQDGRHMEAFQWFLSISKRYPETEEAHFGVMKHYAEQGKSAYVALQYKMLAKALHEEFGVQPSTYVTNWYKRWCDVKDTNEML